MIKINNKITKQTWILLKRNLVRHFSKKMMKQYLKTKSKRTFINWEANRIKKLKLNNKNRVDLFQNKNIPKYCQKK